MAEYTSTTAGSVRRRWVHGPGIDEPIVYYQYPSASTTIKVWLIADHLGSVLAEVNTSGAHYNEGTYIANYSYGPFGELNIDAGRYRYTGQQRLDGTDLHYYKARIYHPKLGRFLQTDPIGTVDDLNLYAYTGNNPVNYTDPTGQFVAQAGMFFFGAGIDVAAQRLVERKPWSDISWKDAALSGAAAAFTGNVAAGAAKLATKGAWTVGKAVTVTAGAGAVAGGAVPLASAGLSSDPDRFKDIGTKISVGAVSGMATAGAGARVTASAAAQIQKFRSAGSVWSHIADTTTSAYSYGSFALGTTALSEIGKFGIDATGAFLGKSVEQSLLGGSSIGTSGGSTGSASGN